MSRVDPSRAVPVDMATEWIPTAPTPCSKAALAGELWGRSTSRHHTGRQATGLAQSSPLLYECRPSPVSLIFYILVLFKNLFYEQTFGKTYCRRGWRRPPSWRRQPPWCRHHASAALGHVVGLTWQRGAPTTLAPFHISRRQPCWRTPPRWAAP